MTQRALRLRLTWERADGVVAPELAATWCDLRVDIGEDSITLVRDRRNDAIRQEIRTAAYPLALWVAEHWWALTEHVRASVADTDALRWTARFRPSWLSSHNVRGVGDGMPWPDLSILPEGSVARLVWWHSPGLAGQPVNFLTSGNAFVSMAELRAELTEFVESVLTRLDNSGIRETALHREWESLAGLDADEREFARACARLGLDPFYIPETLADQVEQLDHTVAPELLEDFLDTASPEHLGQAAAWVGEAEDHLHVAEPVKLDLTEHPVDERRPWSTGYKVASEVRQQLGLDHTERIELDDLVGLARLERPAQGLRGLAGRVDDRIGLVLPPRDGGSLAVRFSQAWALGLTTVAGRRRALLDPSHRTTPRAARAFAAELLAPAAGIEHYLKEAPEPGERAFELIGDRFGANPTLIAHQYRNQVAATRP